MSGTYAVQPHAPGTLGHKAGAVLADGEPVPAAALGGADGAGDNEAVGEPDAAGAEPCDPTRLTARTTPPAVRTSPTSTQTQRGGGRWRAPPSSTSLTKSTISRLSPRLRRNWGQPWNDLSGRAVEELTQ